MPAVEVDDLVVRYGDLVAVDHVSFCAEAGAITAVLGPNGAGKTSTIEVCEGYRSATSGSTTVLGMNPQSEQTKLSKRMGVMLQEGGVSLGARVGDIARLYCDLYGKGVNPSALLESVGLGERIRSSYRRLSGGEKQRLSLALALAARPDVAFLDEPTSGSTTVLGMNPQTEQTKLRKRMGVMLQEGGVSLGARVGDIARLYCDLYGKGVNPSALLESVGLGERIRSSYRRLSGGEKQRLSLALALAARPDVAFLDEPTSGVDITGRQLIRGIVRELADQGCAVVLATHELDEAERVADHVLIFDRGRIIADGTLDDLRRGHDEIRFRTSPTLALSELSTALGLPVRALGDGEFVIDGDAQHVGALTTWLAQHNEPLADLRAGRQRLEDVFLRLTGGAS